MKLLKPFNLILFSLIPIIMFFGFSLRSFASGISSQTFQIRHSTTSYNDNLHNCTVNLSGNPSFSINRETNSSSYTGDTIYATLKVTTSEGTFDIKSSSTYISSSTSTSNLGFNDLGSVTLPGYFINLFVDYSSGIYKGGGITGTEYGTVTSTSMYTTYSGDITGAIQSTYDMARISGIGNSSYGSFTNGVYDNDENILDKKYTVFYGYNYNATSTANDLNQKYNTYIPIQFSVNPLGDYWGYRLVGYLSNGGSFIVSENYYTSSTTSVNFSVNRATQYMVNYLYLTVYGVDVANDITFTQKSFSHNLVNQDPINVYDTREASEWNIIENSDELENIDKTSVSMNEIISYNNDTFNDDFSDYDDYISRVDLTGSKTNFNRLTILSKYCLNSFYNGLPNDYKSLIRICLNIGLAMMVLTVGTRVVHKRGQL